MSPEFWRDEATDAIDQVSRLSEAARIERNLSLLSQPPLFDIEIASACNVVCAFCPRDEMLRKRGLMDQETFESVRSFLPDKAVAMLSGLGDASMHPLLPTFVEQLVARGVSTCLITNGVRLTPQLQDKLIAAGISEVQVSVHGVTEATVQRVVPEGSSPAMVREHVERLAKVSGIRLRINFVETPENIDERSAVESWANLLGARFFHRRQHTRGGTIDSSRRQPDCSGCGIFGSVTFISSDGDVMPCVNDVRGEGKYGNVRDLTWNSIVEWKRRVVTSGQWFAPCRNCDDDYRWVLLARGGLAGT